MNVMMNSNLHTTEDMLMIYLFFFRAPDHLEKFKNYLNSKQRNIRFTSNKEKNNFMPFLDNLITRTSNGF